jgi:TonB family protein
MQQKILLSRLEFIDLSILQRKDWLRMPSPFKRTSLHAMFNFKYLMLTILLGFSTSFGQTSTSQAAPLQESFRGTFQQEPNSDKGGSTSPSIVFVESNGVNKFSTIAQSFYRFVPQREYLLNGIFVQKHLPEKPKSAEYIQLVQSAWPDMDSEALKSTAREVEVWIKKNPKKPLVLLCSLRRADTLAGKRHNPIMIAANVLESNLISRVIAVYPQAAKSKHISGNVLLQVTIDEEGNVEEIIPKSGPPLLVPAAMAAVQQWKYRPILLNGEPVPAIATTMVLFKLYP